MKNWKILFGTLILICLFLIVPMPNTEEKSHIELKESGTSLSQEIKNKIPIGTKIQTAKMILEKNNFTCKIVKDGNFLNRQKIDYVYCDLEKSSWSLISKRWQVALIQKNERLIEVLASFGLSGP